MVGALTPIMSIGCAGRYSGPRTLASVAALAVVAGSAAWATGEAIDSEQRPSLAHGFATGGFVTVLSGLAAIVVAGGWMAGAAACNADPDCDEEEQCREIPAPPGGIPYKQCMSR